MGVLRKQRLGLSTLPPALKLPYIHPCVLKYIASRIAMIFGQLLTRRVRQFENTKKEEAIFGRSGQPQL
jgi:hypothetical protein